MRSGEYIIARNNSRGVTLIEILLVVTLSALLMAGIIPFIRSVNDVWGIGSSKTEVLQNGRIALEAITRYIRQSARILTIPGSNGNYVKLRDPDDNYNIIFYHNVTGSPYYIGASGVIKDNDLVMRSDESGAYTDSLLASSLENFNIIFLQEDGSLATQANEVKTCKIEMQLSDAQGLSAGELDLEGIVTLRKEPRILVPIWAITSAGIAPSNDRLKEFSGDIEVTGFRIDNISYDSSDCLSVNLADGSCWVADTVNDRVVHISASAEILDVITGFNKPDAVSVDEIHNTVWVADTGANLVKRLRWGGSGWVIDEFSQKFKSPSSVSVNPNESGSEVCWVADTANNRIVKLSSAGQILVDAVRKPWNFSRPRSVSVNRNTGVCWVADTQNNRVVSLQPNGNLGDTYRGFKRPRSVSVNKTNGECWVADSENDSVKKITSSGSILEFRGFSWPQSVSVNFLTGNCWVADYGNNQIVRLNAEGDEEFRIGNFSSPVAVATRP